MNVDGSITITIYFKQLLYGCGFSSTNIINRYIYVWKPLGNVWQTCYPTHDRVCGENRDKEFVGQVLGLDGQQHLERLPIDAIAVHHTLPYEDYLMAYLGADLDYFFRKSHEYRTRIN